MPLLPKCDMCGMEPQLEYLECHGKIAKKGGLVEAVGGLPKVPHIAIICNVCWSKIIRQTTGEIVQQEQNTDTL